MKKRARAMNPSGSSPFVVDWCANCEKFKHLVRDKLNHTTCAECVDASTRRIKCKSCKEDIAVVVSAESVPISSICMVCIKRAKQLDQPDPLPSASSQSGVIIE
jgi:hypothetical protein